MKPLTLLPLTPPDSPSLVPILEVEEDNLDQSHFYDAPLHGLRTGQTAKFTIMPCTAMSPAPLFVPEIMWLNHPYAGDRVVLPPAPPPSPVLSRPSPIPYCPKYEEASTLGPWDTPSLPDPSKESPLLPMELDEDPSSFLDSYCSSFEDESWDEFDAVFVPSSQRSSSFSCLLGLDDPFTLSVVEEPATAFREEKQPARPSFSSKPTLLSVPAALKRNASFDTAMSLREVAFSLQRARPPGERQFGRSSSSSYFYSEWDDEEEEISNRKPGWFRSLGSRQKAQRPGIQRRASSPETGSDACSSKNSSIRRQKTEKFLGPLDRLFGGRSKKS